VGSTSRVTCSMHTRNVLVMCSVNFRDNQQGKVDEIKEDRQGTAPQVDEMPQGSLGRRRALYMRGQDVRTLRKARPKKPGLKSLTIPACTELSSFPMILLASMANPDLTYVPPGSLVSKHLLRAVNNGGIPRIPQM
jgi:hypothetical protein